MKTLRQASSSRLVGLVAALLLATALLAQSNTTLQCFYDDLGQLTKVVGPNGNITTYAYDAVGNLVSIAHSSVAPDWLTIFNFNPQQGSVGTHVTIQGQNFSSTPTSNTVKFNGTPAVVLSATSTKLLVAVPLGASSGVVSVTVGGTTAYGPNFAVLPGFIVLPVNPSATLGNTVQFTAMETFSDGSSMDETAAAAWSSSLPAIATVSNTQGSAGLATTLAAGATSITATLGSLSGSTILTVNASALASLTVAPSNPSVGPGTFVHFSATGTLTNGSSQDETSAVTWTSSDAAVATISNASGSQGLATTLTNGTTTIKATLSSVSSSTTLTVTQALVAIPRFALLSNGDGTISIFAVDANTGQLRTTGYASIGPNLNQQGSYPAIDPSGQFVYLVTVVPGNVLGFSIDPNRGALTPIPGSPFGSQATAVAVNAQANFVLVTSHGINSDTVTAYTIGPGGTLTPAPGGSSSTGSFPLSVTTDPSGKFVYVGNGGGSSISAFVLDRTSGALTPVNGSPFAATGCAGQFEMTINPSGRFLYVPCTDMVLAFAIDSSTGALKPVNGSPFTAGWAPVWVTAEPSGKFLYVVNQNSNNVSAFNIDPTTGALTPVAQSPFSVGTSPISMTVDPSGKFAYVVGVGNNNFTTSYIASYAVDGTSGALIPGQAYRFRANGGAIAISKSSTPLTFTPTFAYIVNNSDNTVSANSIDPATGALSPVPKSPFGAGLGATSVTSDPAGKLVYVANSAAGTVSAYTIDSVSGSIAQTSGSPFAAGSGPSSVIVEPSGRFTYAPNQASNNVSAYGIAPTTGVLTPIANSPFSAHSGPVAATIEPLGKFAYVANQTSNDVSILTIDSFGGGLRTLAGPQPAGSAPVSVVVDPTGKFVYVANSGSNTVSAYSITNPSNGGLTEVLQSPFPAGTNPSSLTVDVSGRFLYVANAGSNDVSAYSIDSSTGALTAIASPFPAGKKPSSVTEDLSGKFLYVVNSGDNTVSVFTINPTSGTLSPSSSFPTGSNPKSITTTGKIQ